MNEFKLKEVAKNTYRFTGEKTFNVNKNKYIEQDGETYRNSYVVEEVYNADRSYQEFPNRIWSMEYDFKMLGLDVEIQVPYVPYSGSIFLNQAGYMFSENEYVNYIQQAFYQGILDTRIKDLYTGREPTSSFKSYQRNYKTKEERHADCVFFKYAPIPIMSYGWNNALYYEVGTLSFLKAEYEYIPNEILEYLINKGIFAKKKDIKKNTLNLLTNKLSYYETTRH